MGPNYVLITAARNEEAYIRLTIESVLAQTILPKKWVIVSDGSTDGTDHVVAEYLEKCGFIELIRKEKDERQPGFASKVMALRLGHQKMGAESYNYIGHLDADVSFEERYYQSVLGQFQNNPRLGIAGGFVYEYCKDRFKSRAFNNVKSVAGSIQLFRRKCYETIGGFIPLETGGEDWHAEITARMNGWEVEAFRMYPVFHHRRSSGIARSFVEEGFRQGRMDYLLGSHPLFEIIKCFSRLREKPYLIAAFLRMASFASSHFRSQDRPVSDEFVNYLRREQLQRVKSHFFSLKKDIKETLNTI